ASDAYVAGLTAYREGDPQAWLAFFAEAVFDAARAGEALADEVRALQAEWSARAGNPRRDSAAAAIIAALPAVPVIDLRAARGITGASAKATLQGIDRLAQT